MINWSVVAHELRQQSQECTDRARALKLRHGVDEAFYHEMTCGAIFIGLALALQTGLSHPDGLPPPAYENRD